MLILILALLALLPGELVMRVVLARLTEMPRPRLYVLVTCLQGWLGWIMNNRVLTLASAQGFVIFNTLLTFVLVWLFAAGRCKLRALLLNGLLFGVQTMGSMGVVAVWQMAGLPREALVDSTVPLFPLAVLLCSLINIPLTLLVEKLVRWYSSQPLDRRYRRWMVVVPMAQVVMLICIYWSYWVTEMRGSMQTSFVLCVLVMLGSNIFYLVAYRRYIFSQEQTQKLRQAEAQIETQAAYYERMQESILRVNQLRHDLNNQLQAARYLLEQGQTDQVRSQLDLLGESIARKVGPRYCANLMVDAVLSEKAKLCREKGLTLEVSVLLPGEIGVSNAHLCSIFSNLLDNSIRAAEASGSAEPIRVRSDVQRGYLVIHCENPALPPKKAKDNDPLRRHGLGLTILAQLARRYGGHMDAAYSDGHFTVDLLLRSAGEMKQ